MGIIRSQQARGWETLHLTTPRYHPSTASYEAIDGQIFHRSRKVHVSAPVLREFAEMQETKRRLTEIIRAERPDILHAHSPVINALPAISVARQFGLPVVYEVRAFWEDAAVDHGTVREGGLRYRASRQLETYAMRSADRIVALCEPLRAEIVARGIPAEHITVVPNAVDTRLLSLTAAPDQGLRGELGLFGRTVLGFIGSFYAYEGLDLLLNAVPVLSQRIPELAIILVGGGPEEERLRKIVQDSGIEQFVRFTGRVHHDEVARYYDAVDVMVFPRRRNRLTELVTPLKPLEAMAQVKPVVASDVGGHRELIRDSETGYLFAADDVTAFATKLEAVVADACDRRRVAANGRRFVEKERTWDAVVERYGAVYEQLLRNNRPAQLVA